VVHVAVLVVTLAAAILLLRTSLRLKVIRVIVALVPSMRVGTVEALRARVLIHTDCLGGVPAGARLFRVLLKLGLAAEILPVMRVGTSAVAHMARVDKRTPHRLVVEVVEVDVHIKLADQVDTDLRFVVCEGAVLAVVAQACH
jgi:ribose 5-phosphate isomerase